MGHKRLPPDFPRDFEALCLDEQPLIMNLSKFQAWVIFCHLQLALRHPRNIGPTAKHARAIAEHLERQLATTPALKRVAVAGWDPQQDL